MGAAEDGPFVLAEIVVLPGQPCGVIDLVDAYETMVARHRRGDVESCLVTAGKFVEHTFSAFDALRAAIAEPLTRVPRRCQARRAD
jgi:hypothetical protein